MQNVLYQHYKWNEIIDIGEGLSRLRPMLPPTSYLQNKDDLGDLKVSKDEIIENVAEKILTQEKSVAVVDNNNQIIGSINPTKIINTVFGGRKNNN